MSQNKKPCRYLVIKGECGLYNNMNAAVQCATSCDDIIPLYSNYDTEIINKLYSVAYTRRDVIFKNLYPLIDLKQIEIYEHIQSTQKYTTAYCNRYITSDGESTYGIWLLNEHQSYCYKSPLQLCRGSHTDEVILLKLQELANTGNLTGVVYTPFPLTTEIQGLLPNWEFKRINPFDYDIFMISLNEELKGNKPIIPVTYI